MGLRFIFMLTRDDRTVPDAMDNLEAALSMGVRHIGFKDVGLPVRELKSLNAAIKAKGATSYLEVVSLDPRSEIASARAAIEIGVDVLLGGTRADAVLPVIEGSDIAYFPFPGRIIGHPSVLEGSIDDIAASARSLASREGVDGLDLLAYRSPDADVPALIRAVVAAAGKPVIVAGSIADRERIAAVHEAGAAGFTIGTAALDGQYPSAGADVQAQLGAIVRDVAALNGHLSRFGKQSLNAAFQSASMTDSPLGHLNGTPIRIETIEGTRDWAFHAREDFLFMVHQGRLLIRFRDREEAIESGEFIVIPRGVDHSIVALTPTCQVLVFGRHPVN